VAARPGQGQDPCVPTSGRPLAPDGAVTLSLAHTEPYAWDDLLRWLAARAIPGVEEVIDGEYRRAFSIGGVAGRVAVRPGREPGKLLATVSPSSSKATAIPEVASRLGHLLDLGSDARSIDAHLGRDPLLAPLVRARPGLRVPGAWDAFELAVRAILGQQVSVAAARTFAGRIAAAHGERVPGGEPAMAFPGPARLADASLEGIGLTRARASALRALARAVVESPGLLAPAEGLEATVARLVALPGIGEWTAQYVAMRAFRERDAFPASDLGLLRAATRGGRRPTPAALLRRAERWRPWRAYAAMHLWAAGAPARR
jgi:AraC family transcriptional regulator of adaptative response / DNA-3-methyladenine glycosylase II